MKKMSHEDFVEVLDLVRWEIRSARSNRENDPVWSTRYWSDQIKKYEALYDRLVALEADIAE